MSDPTDNTPRRQLPTRLAQEQFAMGFLLSLVSRSLTFCVIAAAMYLAYMNWR